MVPRKQQETNVDEVRDVAVYNEIQLNTKNSTTKLGNAGMSRNACNQLTRLHKKI